MSWGAPCTWRKIFKTCNKGFQCLVSLTGRGGGPASGVKGFVNAAASVQERIGRYRWGWGTEANELQVDRWDTHYGKGEGLGKQSPIKETA